MLLNYLIIDDFLDNAEQLRELALKQHFPELAIKTNYPGRNAEQAVNIPEITDIVSSLTGEKLTPKPGTSHGKFRIAFAEDKGQANVHIDNCTWSGILYLSRDKDCRGGTNFYRHRPTNTEHAPITLEQLNALGMTDIQQVWNDIIGQDTNDKSKWELTMSIPMKFNRLILFRPWLYHDADHGFGATLEEARLIYPLFFQNSP